MYGLRLEVGRFDEQTLAQLLRVLVEHNIRLLKRERLPLLYASGVRYEREPPGTEQWRAADRILADGFGDCEDLAAWRAAEIAVHGISAVGSNDRDRRETTQREVGYAGDFLVRDVAAVLRRIEENQYHVVVQYFIGGIRYEDDPSLRLGMPRQRRPRVATPSGLIAPPGVTS